MANNFNIKSVPILITGPLTEGSGNYSTAHRIRSYFEDAGIKCYTRNISDFKDISDFKQFLLAKGIQCVLAIHAFKSGKFLKECPVQFVLIFGGTDLNESIKVSNDREIVLTVARLARFLVVFSTTMLDKVSVLLPDYDQKRICTIPQAVKTYPAEYNWKREFAIENDAVILTLIAGIRPVKDPLFLLRAFSDWCKSNIHRKTYLVIVGPEHDSGFMQTFLETVKSSTGVLYLGPMSIPQTHRVIADSFALVNSSVSEGMSTAILEAMELGIPVIARNIPGNASIISHKQTGLLYNDPREFLEMAELLMDDCDLRKHVVKNALKQVIEQHGLEMERSKYFELVKQLTCQNLAKEQNLTKEQEMETAILAQKYVPVDGSSHYDIRNFL